MSSSLSAWQRWQLADFSEPQRPGTPVREDLRAVSPAPAPPAPPALFPASTAVLPPPLEDVTPQPLPAESEIKPPTLDEIEQIMNQAQREGFAAGYEEGVARARIEALRINSLVEQIDDLMNNLDKAVAEEILSLAVEVARQVVREHLAVKEDAILAVVKEALRQLPHQSAVIYLNPDDAELVMTHLGEQLSGAGHRIKHDPTVSRGGCAIEAEGTQIDASLEIRWRRVVESFGIKSAWTPAPEDQGHES